MRRVPWLCALLLVLASGLFPGASAQASPDLKSTVVIVSNDQGGSVSKRAQFIRKVKRANLQVRIEGWMCNSSCTMLAFLPQTCIDPKTVFGFHGPFIDSRKMTEKEFEDWSRFMAQYYPPDFRRWFLQEARYAKKYELMRVTGKEMIRFGAKPCPSIEERVTALHSSDRQK